MDAIGGGTFLNWGLFLQIGRQEESQLLSMSPQIKMSIDSPINIHTMSCFSWIRGNFGRDRFEPFTDGIVPAVADFPLGREAMIRLHIGKKKMRRYVRCHFQSQGKGEKLYWRVQFLAIQCDVFVISFYPCDRNTWGREGRRSENQRIRSWFAVKPISSKLKESG